MRYILAGSDTFRMIYANGVEPADATVNSPAGSRKFLQKRFDLEALIWYNSGYG